MAITEAQRQERKKYICSSDWAAILGIDPYKTTYEIYCQKIYDVEPLEVSEKAMLGLDFEKNLVEWLSRKIGHDINTSPDELEFIKGIFCSHPDGIVIDTPDCAEVKMTGLCDEWEDEGTDRIPRHFWVQCQAHCYCGEFNAVNVAVMLIGFYGYDMKYYRIEQSNKFIKPAVEKCLDFWHNNVEKKIPPDSKMPSLKFFNTIKRTPNKYVELDENLVSAYETAKKYHSDANKALEGTKALILRAFGDAEGAKLNDGRLLTFMEIKRKGFMVEDMTYRQLKFKKEK